jgi:hypothetical protein
MRVLLVMKWQITWQERDLNIHSQDLNQLAASQMELPRKQSGLDEEKSQKTLRIHNWTQTGKGTYTRALCQKNEGSVEIKQRPIKMGGMTIYRTLSHKMTPFQTGIDT